MKAETRKQKEIRKPKSEIRMAASRFDGPPGLSGRGEMAFRSGEERFGLRISDFGFSATVASFLLLVAAVATAATAFPAASALPAQTNLPNPLVMFDGRPVTNRAQWFAERRPELQALFQHYEYGTLPPKPERVEAKVVAAYSDFLGGKATLKLVEIKTGPANAPKIDLMVVVPNARTNPAPVFLTMNFCGNHAVTADPRVPLARGWVYTSCKGCPNGVATDAGRGSQATNWPVHLWPLDDIVQRGYAFASFYSGDIDSDRANVSDGLYAWLAGSDVARNDPTNRGSIAAWAWGFHRCVDYLVKDPDVNPRQIAALGHSRNGKATLLAAAFDERIAIAFPHQAGCGGTAPARGTVGESVKRINTSFPHWFNGAFKEFNDVPERLPFDHNAMVALCAPRPVLFSCATGDQWSNPAGQFEVLAAAEPVYRFLGAPGLGVKEMPPVGQLVGERLGYFIREGKHAMTADDWKVFMDFADRQFKSAAK
jgi:hypothetical protein